MINYKDHFEMKYSAIYILAALMVILSGCEKTGEAYKEYLQTGEIYYPGRIDSLSLLTGNLRGRIRFKMTSDPKVTRLKAFVRNSLSPDEVQIDIPVQPNEYGSIKQVDLPNLKETSYSISIRSYSAANDSSRAVAASQFIYGPNYNSALSNRIFSAFRLSGAKDSILFRPEINLPKPGIFYIMQLTEIVYTNTGNGMDTVRITPYENRVALPGIKNPSVVQYRTAFMPIENCIDLFYTPFIELPYSKP
jgi:hypothetical protein